MLTLRMIIYFLSALIAGQGIAVFDPDAGTLTFDLEHIELLLGGIATFIGTFWTSRIAKKNGGAT